MASQKDRQAHDSLCTRSGLQARSSLSDQSLAFLGTRPFPHEVDRVFQWHRLATQAFDGHGFDELLGAKDVKAAGRCVEVQHDLMARQISLDVIRGSIDENPSIRFHSPWVPSPVKGVDEADQGQPSSATLGGEVRSDKRPRVADCDNCVLGGAVLDCNAAKIPQ
jgi:hypothetical protein